MLTKIKFLPRMACRAYSLALVLTLAVSVPMGYAQCLDSPVSTPVTVTDEVAKSSGSRMLSNGSGTSINLTTPGRISVDASFPAAINISTYSGGGTYSAPANSYTRVTSATGINLPGTGSVPVGTTIGLTIGGAQGSTTINTNGGANNEDIIFNGSITNHTLTIKNGDQIILANQGSGTWMVTNFLPQGGSSGSTFSVSQGGSGTNSFTAHGVLLGNGSSSLNATSAGTAGYVLTSNGASADPTWQPGGVATQDVNLIQIGGASVATGNGTTSSGTQRVTLSSDSTGSIASINTSVTPGTGAANLGKAEDAVHASGDTGVAILGVRQDTNAGFVSANGDYSPIAVNSHGAVKVTQEPSQKPTYVLCNPQFVVPATPGELVTFYGSSDSSKIVKILRIELLTEQTTPGANFIHLYRRNSQPSGGASTTVTTPFLMDTNNAAPTAVMKYWTTKPTDGGNPSPAQKFLDGWDIEAPDDANNAQPNFYEVFDASQMGQPIVLRGVNDGLAFNFNGVALPAGFKIQVRITFTEE